MKKYTKTIPGVTRQYMYTGTSCFLVYGKTDVQARYGVFGIVDGEVKQVKRVAAAMTFNRMEYKNARKFADLCEHMYPEYRFEVREHVRLFRKWEIDESLYEYRVVKLCLQPLVENAVKHGLKPLNYAGTIWIRAMQLDSALCICIENDGVEMSVSEIAAMNHSFAQRNGFQDARVGLLNINERIKLLYGLEYGLRIEKRGEGLKGMKVMVTFPLT